MANTEYYRPNPYFFNQATAFGQMNNINPYDLAAPDWITDPHHYLPYVDIVDEPCDCSIES